MIRKLLTEKIGAPLDLGMPERSSTKDTLYAYLHGLGIELVKEEGDNQNDQSND
jgi:hypothetical protein